MKCQSILNTFTYFLNIRYKTYTPVKDLNQFLIAYYFMFIFDLIYLEFFFDDLVNLSNEKVKQLDPLNISDIFSIKLVINSTFVIITLDKHHLDMAFVQYFETT